MSDELLTPEEIAKREAFMAKIKTVGVLKGGRTRNKVHEYRRDDGVRVKATTDELGNTVTEHNTKDDRVDVVVRPQVVKGSLKLWLWQVDFMSRLFSRRCRR